LATVKKIMGQRHQIGLFEFWFHLARKM